ncbi:hypothetical protein O6H91_Y105400 [Diphasiastrum complanatum]|nr:hypothetical protein O6H91_Y105400 [Diphasiastrum complanatum]
MDFLFKLLLFLQVAVLIVVVQKSTLYVSGNVFEKAALDTFADSYLVKDAHAKQHCAMYGICGSRKDGRALNCPYPTPAVKPDTAFSNKIQSLCPTITGDVCCTPDQFDLLRSQVQQAVPFLTGCPACLRNFLNLFCEFSCSPDQSLFLNVTSIVKEGTVSSVEGLDFFVTEEFGKNLFDSCKDVKFGSMNTRAMDFIGAGAKTFQEWFSFIGAKAGLYAPGSPFAIRFRTSAPKLSSIRPLNTTMVPCWDSSLSCSCGDCPTAKYCSQAPPTPTNHTSVCAVHIGGNQIRCIDLAMGVIYVMLLLGIAIWWWNSGRVKKMTTQEIAEPLLFAQGTSQDLPPTSGSIEIVPSEVHGEQDTSKEKVSWSFTEVLLSSWFRSQGVWIARHPGLVLLASISIVALLCIGLVRLEVETRPEKLWVSPGSTAASEKNFFDTHLAPFYRIEQLIFSTIPDGKQNLLPPIVTDQNILLMFDIQKKIDELRGNFSGKLVSLQDICTKPLGNECATQSILQYFRMQRSEFAQYGGVSHAAFCFQHYTSSAPCLSAYEAPTDPKTILGGFSGTNYSEATTLVVTYPVQNFVDESGKANAESVAWEEAFIQLAKENLSSMAAAHNLTLAYSSESSIQFELQRESSADVPTILLSYLVMFLYIAISLGDYQPSIAPFYVSSKVCCICVPVGNARLIRYFDSRTFSSWVCWPLQRFGDQINPNHCRSDSVSCTCGKWSELHVSDICVVSLLFNLYSLSFFDL